MQINSLQFRIDQTLQSTTLAKVVLLTCTNLCKSGPIWTLADVTQYWVWRALSNIHIYTIISNDYWQGRRELGHINMGSANLENFLVIGQLHTCDKEWHIHMGSASQEKYSVIGRSHMCDNEWHIHMGLAGQEKYSVIGRPHMCDQESHIDMGSAGPEEYLLIGQPHMSSIHTWGRPAQRYDIYVPTKKTLYAINTTWICDEAQWEIKQTKILCHHIPCCPPKHMVRVGYR